MMRLPAPRASRAWFVALGAVGGLLLLAVAALVALQALSATPEVPTEQRYGNTLDAASEGEEGALPAVSVLDRLVTGSGSSSAPDAAVASTPEPQQATFGAAIERLRIERIGVDAPVVSLNLNAEGDLDAPSEPELVAWYDFTGKPGLGGNAVFSGHLDWAGHGPAVFWDLDALQPGDQIEIALTDGTVLVYQVTAAQSYGLDELDMAEVLATTPRESVTLITCSGEFAAGQYDERHVVRAALAEVRPGNERS